MQVDARAPEGDVLRWQASADVEALAWVPHNPTTFLVSSEDGIVACFDARQVGKSGERPGVCCLRLLLLLVHGLHGWRCCNGWLGPGSMPSPVRTAGRAWNLKAAQLLGGLYVALSLLLPTQPAQPCVTLNPLCCTGGGVSAAVLAGGP